MNEKLLLVEKYRPKSIDECILPKHLQKIFQNFVEEGNIPNLLLSGQQGVGKTTVALALCHQLDYSYLMINGSNEGRLIDTLRSKITNFASTIAFNNRKKVIILDEADYANSDSVLPALRNFMEEFSNNTRFILTCNYKNKIIAPLHSRCSVIDFVVDAKEKPVLASKFLQRLKYILGEENIKFDEQILVKIIMEYFPDFRRILNEIQKFSISGKITTDILTNTVELKTKELLKFLKNKEFTNTRKWVANNTNNDCTLIFRSIYDILEENLEKESVPQSILIIAEYQYKASFVMDQEINLMACLTEIMCQCKFK